MVASPADLYFSIDIESDGPIPGPFSMLSLGMAVAGRFDGMRFERREPRAHTFYCELRPISEQFLPEALAASGLDREHLRREGLAPRTAMNDASAWVRQVAAGDNPVAVAYPLSFDWLFLYWYFERFADAGSPFGFSACLDTKTMFQQKARALIAHAGRDDLPEDLRSQRPHTHNALDDAIEQADIFANIFEWTPDDYPSATSA